MIYNTIEIKVGNFYDSICLNRPEKRNALNAEMITELTSAIIDVSDNPKNRCLVIRGNGKSFSAGADLNYMKETARLSEEENQKDAEELFSLFETIYNCPLPTICYVHGSSFGGSNGIISACDYAIAEVQTVFSFSEVKLGLIPATISPFVLQKIGRQHALDTFLTGKRFDSNYAKEIGLVNIADTEEDALNHLEEYINFFKTSAPEAVKKTKKLVQKLANQNMAAVREFTSKLIAGARVNAEGQEGISAFFENRKPDWTIE